MSTVSRPSLPLPDPLCAAEIPSFTNYSVVVRLPDIARRTLKENVFPPETVQAIQALIDEIPAAPIRPVKIGPTVLDTLWSGWIAPYAGMNWLDIPWFFAEEYFYVRILEATGYFAEGQGHAQDPYTAQKRLGLESTRESCQELAGHIEYLLQRPNGSYQDALTRLLLADLWGNQNDLSMWPVQKSANGSGLTGGAAYSQDSAARSSAEESETRAVALQSAEERLITNELPALLVSIDRLTPLNNGTGARVDIVLDNAGYELVADLALADFLLASHHALQVNLHAKAYPVFVSDALVHDIHDTLDFLALEGHHNTQAMAIRLRSHLMDEQLRLQHHPFWTSPLPMWQMPADLAGELSQSSLLIVKGDANYRRLLGDRHWPIDLPFSQVVDYLPCATLALRTLKSEIAVGIPASRIPNTDPEWMVNGRWGLIEFSPAHR